MQIVSLTANRISEEYTVNGKPVSKREYTAKQHEMEGMVKRIEAVPVTKYVGVALTINEYEVH